MPLLLFFKYFFFFFHIGVFLFFVCVCAASSSTGPSICSCCKPSVCVIITAHVKDYDTRSPSITIDTRVWNWMPSSLWFRSVLLLFFFFLLFFSSSHFLFNIFVIYIRVFHIAFPAQHITAQQTVLWNLSASPFWADMLFDRAIPNV